MGKVRRLFVCSGCRRSFAQWSGRCPSCGRWGAVVESTTGPSARSPDFGEKPDPLHRVGRGSHPGQHARPIFSSNPAARAGSEAVGWHPSLQDPDQDGEVRAQMLHLLYERHRRARGPSGVVAGVREIQNEMRASGVRQSEVASHLDYLVQKGWVREIVKFRPYPGPRGVTRLGLATRYKISDAGIDHFRGVGQLPRPIAGYSP